MLFIEWWLVKRFTVLIALLLVSCAGMWFVRKKRNPLRLVTMILGSPVAVLAGLFLGLQFLALGCLSYSSALYSPDHTHAVRVRTDDEGATGGNSHVEMFWNHGFSSQDVYWGQWKSVGIYDLQWENNSTLDVRHDSPMYVCESTPKVKVQCLDRPSPPALPSAQ